MLNAVEVNLNLGDVYLAGPWKPTKSQKQAAWELYVELITRISVQKLGPDEGLLREALTSLYSLFETTRGILKRHGPEVAKPRRGQSISLGYLAVTALNHVLRPLLAKWHPKLGHYEASRPGEISPAEHEQEWEHHDDLRKAIDDARATMMQCAELLGQVAGIPSLTRQAGRKDGKGPQVGA